MFWLWFGETWNGALVVWHWMCLCLLCIGQLLINCFELHTISAVLFHDILWLFTFQLILYHLYKKLFTIINLYFVLIRILTIQICKYIYLIAGASFNIFFYFFRYSAFMYCISISVLVTITLIRVVSSVPQLKLEIWSIWKRT